MLVKHTEEEIMLLQSINEKSLGVVKKYKEKIEKKQHLKEEAKKKAYFFNALCAAKEDVILKKNHFENVTEDKLLECCILELTAAESRLNYYLSMAKKEKMVNSEYLDVMFYSKEREGGAVL